MLVMILKLLGTKNLKCPLHWVCWWSCSPNPCFSNTCCSCCPDINNTFISVFYDDDVQKTKRILVFKFLYGLFDYIFEKIPEFVIKCLILFYYKQIGIFPLALFCVSCVTSIIMPLMDLILLCYSENTEQTNPEETPKSEELQPIKQL